MTRPSDQVSSCIHYLGFTLHATLTSPTLYQFPSFSIKKCDAGSV